jgi:stage III sporulation protein AF
LHFRPLAPARLTALAKIKERSAAAHVRLDRGFYIAPYMRRFFREVEGMAFLREYATTLIFTTGLSILFKILAPENSMKKYVEFALGAMVALAVFSPAAKLFKTDIQAKIPQISAEAKPVAAAPNLVAKKFEQDLAAHMARRLEADLGVEAAVRLDARTDENGAVTGIEKAYIQPADQRTKEWLAREYGLKTEDITDEAP